MRSLILVVIFTATGFGKAVADIGKATIEGLAFMKGCWVIEGPDRKARIDEHWMAPAGGTMIGISRTVVNGRTSGFEYMRLDSSERGLFFISKPRENSEETAFKLKTFSAGNAVFENLEHDFPQRVIYRSTGPNALTARIEGTQNGKASGVDFPYKRAKCD